MLPGVTWIIGVGTGALVALPLTVTFAPAPPLKAHTLIVIARHQRTEDHRHRLRLSRTQTVAAPRYDTER